VANFAHLTLTETYLAVQT